MNDGVKQQRCHRHRNKNCGERGTFHRLTISSVQ
jgi:hypothetical protein